MHPPAYRFPAILLGIAMLSAGLPAAAAEAPVSATFVESCPAAATRTQVTAVGLRVEAPAQGAVPAAHIMVLVDTSASQTGEYRRRSLDAAAGLVEKGRKGDRFGLAAVDVGFTPLTEKFHAAGDEAMRSAAHDLDARTPLGSTDIVLALEQAAERLPGGKGPLAIVYIGDGPGLIGVDAAEFTRVLDLLRGRRITVSSIGIGPQVNWPCLAALASGTGGAFLMPEGEYDAKQVGAALGAAAIAPVAWPLDVALSSAAADGTLRMLPGRLPPLRADRDAVMLLEGRLETARL